VAPDRLAHCAEGAFFTAAAPRVHGHESSTVHRRPSATTTICWLSSSSAAKSNYAGLRFREPFHFTIRELVMSYYEHYYNPAGEKALRAYSTRPVNLKQFDRLKWIMTEENL
jgi:hypothetical protein